MPASPITTLTDRRVLNMIVNERIKPYTALTNLVFPPSTKKNLFEEYAQVDVLQGTYGMAPFVKIGQNPALVGSNDGTSYTIDTPYIAIERPLKYSTAFAKRMIGQPVFSNNRNMITQMVRQALEEDADYMNTLIDNRLEWMIAYILRGAVSYSAEGYDSFTITTGKPAGNTYAVDNLWDGGSANVFEDLLDAQKVVSARRGPNLDLAICGEEAAVALRALIAGGSLTPIVTTSGIEAGRARLIAEVSDNGMIYMGKIGGVDFFEYTGTFSPDDGGADEHLIRTDYVELMSTSVRSVQMRKLMFGMIPSLRAIIEGNHVTERYMTSIAPTERVDTYSGIIKTRPLPWLYRPDWFISLQVV